jgi:hypothetical protein
MAIAGFRPLLSSMYVGNDAHRMLGSKSLRVGMEQQFPA